ncbi:MAG: hypothetical protein R2727_03405 [Bacteroidales bacterium]
MEGIPEMLSGYTVVPHDIPGLIDLVGRDLFNERLGMFTESTEKPVRRRRGD